eukprot:scaffold265069_cov22-Tisochrysis_lutea.AAC.1
MPTRGSRCSDATAELSVIFSKIDRSRPNVRPVRRNLRVVVFSARESIPGISLALGGTPNQRAAPFAE